MTPIDVKEKCYELKQKGLKNIDIYKVYKDLVDKPMSYHSFRTAIMRWSKKRYADEATLERGTYKGFIAHDATVQVSGDGTITQAWIKQKADNFNEDDFIEAIKERVEPYKPNKEIEDPRQAKRMLEIPLFDMHWGVAYLNHYQKTLDEILELIYSKRWEKIVIPFGQDFFHNDSVVKGETTKGTKIQKVDTQKAVKEGQSFIYAIIDAAIENSDVTNVIYTPGNHDKSISWMFMQILLERYGKSIVDDEFSNRKVIKYGDNAIMITHGNSKQATVKNLSSIFSISFPLTFANAKIREVHAGHLHGEADTDVFGVMVRRLSTGVIEDEWSDSEDYVGKHKRFMLFEYTKEKLKSIHYI